MPRLTTRSRTYFPIFSLIYIDLGWFVLVSPYGIVIVFNEEHHFVFITYTSSAYTFVGLSQPFPLFSFLHWRGRTNLLLALSSVDTYHLAHVCAITKMGNLFQKLLANFYTQNLEVVLVGLENAGKTTFVNVMAMGNSVETVPTIGLNVKIVKKGNVKMKCWDIGGQEQYRGEWGRYTRGCDVIIFVVDSFATEKIATARRELHRLLEDRQLATTPLLILSNKIDLSPHLSESDLIRELNLEYITDNPWLIIPISAVKQTNIDQVVQWLVKQGK